MGEEGGDEERLGFFSVGRKILKKGMGGRERVKGEGDV